MSTNKKYCFVMMPFSTELYYFYLHLKRHIEDTHNVHCERADGQVLIKPVLEKIKDMITKADVIIADCSERNPNVFYELGLAHAFTKKVILITRDEIKEAPSDIKHYEFIKYELGKDEEFFKKLDNALNNVFFEDYQDLYKKAQKIFKEFEKATKTPILMTEKSIFLSLIRSAEKTRDIPSLEDDDWKLKEFLLPKIIKDSSDFRIMEQITTWLSKK